MKTLYMVKGLPGSGKSTWAKAKVKSASYEQLKRVNKDELRAMLDCGHSSPLHEKFVLNVRNNIIASALNAGISIIVDDTNLAPKHEETLTALSVKHGAKFEIVDLTHVSLDECIARDKKRANYVGEDVIRKMHKDYLTPAIKVENAYGYTYVPDTTLPKCVIIDIDGTVASRGNRSPYHEKLVHLDTPHNHVIDLIKLLCDYGDVSPVFVSGRTDGCKDLTTDWLNVNGFRSHAFELYMRKTGDTRDDTIVKCELFQHNIAKRYNVLYTFDDRNKVVKMWRDIGLKCFQVAEGDF